MNYTCYSSSLICIFDFFRLWKPQLLNPLSKHQLLHKMMVLFPPKLKLSLLPKLKQILLLSCPQFHHAKWVWQFLLGRKKSIVWDHFEKIKIGKGDTSKTKAICNYCQKLYNADSKSYGTSNLLAHVPICSRNPNREDLVKRQKTLAFEPKKDGEDGFLLCQQPFLSRLLERHWRKWL